ncbi:MAG TPA: hypothetical protein VME21_00605 [Steroidobacteraceae bacterium]|nr:hypothetical protein [Steroidobacteraceae bacterium]
MSAARLVRRTLVAGMSLALLSLGACVGDGGYGYGVDYDVGYWGPCCYDYGWWGPGWRTGPPPFRGRPGGGFHPGAGGHPGGMPSIPTRAPRGGAPHGGGRR